MAEIIRAVRQEVQAGLAVVLMGEKTRQAQMARRILEVVVAVLVGQQHILVVLADQVFSSCVIY